MSNDPYHYARDHYGRSVWCVRGPNGFYLSVPEKNLAYAIGKMLSGDGVVASHSIRGLFHSLEREGFPDYLKEPTHFEMARSGKHDTLHEQIAEALYDDNLRQINANSAESADRNKLEPMIVVQKPFAQAEDFVRKMYLSYARAVFPVARFHKPLPGDINARAKKICSVADCAAEPCCTACRDKAELEIYREAAKGD